MCRRSNPKLHSELWINQVLADSFAQPGTVAGRLSGVIGPGIAVRIKMNQRQRPAVPCTIGTQQ
jgi:hypothetical protein